MGLGDVVDALERVERLLDSGETGAIQSSLKGARSDPDVQLGKACALLNACRQLRYGDDNHVSTVELSFGAIERSFQFYLVETTAIESSELHRHEDVFAEIAARNVFSDRDVASRIDGLRNRHRASFYYDLDRPGADLADALFDLAEATHEYVVEFANAHSRCRCDD